MRFQGENHLADYPFNVPFFPIKIMFSKSMASLLSFRFSFTPNISPRQALKEKNTFVDIHIYFSSFMRTFAWILKTLPFNSFLTKENHKQESTWPAKSLRAGRRASCPRRCCSSGGGSRPWWRSAATSSWCQLWRGRWTCGRPTSRRSQRASSQSGSWEI